MKVVGQADTISNVPTVVAYKESNPNWEYGDAYMVGTSSQGADTVEVSDATLLVLTRANTVYSTDFWMNLGEFPKPGPQGATGAQGEKGDKGDKGLGVIQGTGEPIAAAENGTTYIDSSNGDVYLRANSTWVLTGNIRGPQGIRGATGAQGVQGKIGPQGPQGVQGERGIGVNILGTLTSTAQLPDPSTVGKDSAYIIPADGVNHLWVIEGTDNLVWTDFGTAGIGEKGDKGDAGRGIDTLTAVDLTYGNTTVTYDATNGMTVNGTARFTYPDGNHDANMGIEVPIVGSDTIIIDKAADSEKIEVKVDTDKFVNRYIDNFDTGSYYEENVYGFIYDNGNFHPTYFGIGSPAPNNIARYTEDGKLMVVDYSTGMPEASEAVPMTYLESNYIQRQYDEYAVFTTNDVAGVEMIPYSTSANPDTMVRRDSSGRVRTADPVGQNDAVNKAYADNRFRYTHFIEVKCNPAPEPYEAYTLTGIITYVSESTTPITSIDDLPLDVTLPIHGKMYADAAKETYTATRKTRSDGSSYLVVTYLEYTDSNGIAIKPYNMTPTSFTDTVF